MAYVLGGSAKEVTRLAKQAALYRQPTIDFFNRVGITKGMTVAELGCGIGSATEILVSMVGAAGTVYAYDNNPDFLALTHLRCPTASVRQLDMNNWSHPLPAVDAVVGRFVLTYADRPVALIKRWAEGLGRHSIVAFMEMDGGGARQMPASLECMRANAELQVAFEAAGHDYEFGATLPAILQRAGVTEHKSHGIFLFEHGAGAYYPQWLNECRVSAGLVDDPGLVAEAGRTYQWPPVYCCWGTVE